MELDEKGFTVRAVAPGSTVSPYSVSAYMLYENADPIHLTEPGVRIDTSDSRYVQTTSTSVRVEGTRIEYTPYTMKLEGSGPVGYQTISIVGIRDRAIMADPTVDEPAGTDNPLFSFENVIMTPHCAGSSEEALIKASMACAKGCFAILNNQAVPLPAVVV